MNPDPPRRNHNPELASPRLVVIACLQVGRGGSRMETNRRTGVGPEGKETRDADTQEGGRDEAAWRMSTANHVAKHDCRWNGERLLVPELGLGLGDLLPALFPDLDPVILLRDQNVGFVR